MKKILLSLILSLFSMTFVFAYDFAVANDDGVMIYYNRSGTNATVTYKTITDRGYSGNIAIPNEVVYNGTTYVVTAIGNSAFSVCNGLTSITIPNSIIFIGSTAFLNCNNLKNIVLEDGAEILSFGTSPSSYPERAFENCPIENLYMGRNISYYASFSPFKGKITLTSIIIGSSVTSFENYVFQNCSGLTSITIPNFITAIGYFAFSGCSGLKNVVIEDSNATLSFGSNLDSNKAFENCPIESLYIGRNISYHSSSGSSSPFKGKTTLTSVSIGNLVTLIGSYIFQNCSGLTYIVIPNSVTAIGYSAFDGCSGLTETLTIPNSVTSISAYAFQNCSGLTHVVLEDGTETLSWGYDFSDAPLETLYLGRNVTGAPFSAKTTLMSVTIGNLVTSIGYSAFSLCSGLTGTLVIPSSVTSIGQYAFSHCHGLTGTLTIPNSVTSIDAYAFQNCSGLTHIVLEDGTETLSWGNDFIDAPIESLYLGRNITGAPFKGKTILMSITIGNLVTSIENSAFSGCNGLKSIVIEDGTETLSFGTSSYSDKTFENCPLESLYLGRNISYYLSNSPFKDNVTLTSLTIGSSVTSIKNNTFQNCSGLTNVILEDGTEMLSWDTDFSNTPVQSLYLGRNIAGSPFKNKSTLTLLTISNSVTTIDNLAFMGCGVASLIIPNSVISIGNNAFSGCNILKELFVDSSIPATIYENTFPDNIKPVVVYVPLDAFATYVTTDIWKNLFLLGKDNNGALYYITQIHREEGGSIITVNNEDGEFVLSKLKEDITVSLKNEAANYRILINGMDFTADFQDNTTIFSPLNINHIYTYQFTPVSRFVIHLTNSGTLIDSIGVANVNNVKELVISGNLNGTDILTIRKMTNLISLDMTNANIVSGGESYYQTYTTSANKIGDYFFKEKANLAIITLPKTVTTIGDYAFSDCRNLKFIVIPDAVTTIGSNAFSGCSGLSGLILENGTANLSGSYNFIDCPIENLYLGRNISNVPFQNKKMLTNLTVGNAVSSITNSAFYGCNRLKNVTLEDGTTTLSFGSAQTFENCPIESLYLGRNLSYSSDYSPFKGKTILASLTIGNNVTSIGQSAFNGCSGLTGTLIIPNAVTSIGSFAFGSCNGLTSLIIGNSVTSIGDNAFSNCINLTDTLSIPNSVSSIGDSAFSGCNGLSALTIGNNVTSIGNSAFSGCTNLMEINSKNPTPPQAQSNTFAGVDKQACTLYVPVGCTTIYWLHPVWEEFLNIQEKEFLQSQTITFPEIAGKIYGDAGFALTGTSSSGLPLVYISSNTDVAAITGNTVTPLNAGTAQITATQSGNAEYDVAATVTRTLTVNKASLTITADNKTRKQGEANPDFTLSYAGFKNNETVSVLDVLPSATCSATANSPVGYYDIVLSGGSDNNYVYNLANGQLEITAATGLAETERTPSLRIYPNPAGNDLYLQSDKPIEKIEIFNQSGVCVLIKDNPGEKLDVSVLSDGFYLARIYIEGIPVTTKIVIKR